MDNYQLIKGEISKAASDFDNFEKFTKGAADAAKKIGFENIDKLIFLLKGIYIDKPDNIKGKFEGIGEWNGIVQNTIFQIIYNFGAGGIEELEKIAFGPFDQTQYKAVRVLTWLAYDGIEVGKILDNLNKHIDEFRHDALIPSVDFLADIKDNDVVLEILQRNFVKTYNLNKYDDAFQILFSMSKNYLSNCERYKLFLKEVALSNSSKVKDIKGEFPYELNRGMDEIYRIRAAVLYYRISKEDPEINEYLFDISKNHVNLSLRDQITQFLKG